jgi:hypothetical protein
MDAHPAVAAARFICLVVRHAVEKLSGWHWNLNGEPQQSRLAGKVNKLALTVSEQVPTARGSFIFLIVSSGFTGIKLGILIQSGYNCVLRLLQLCDKANLIM